MAFLRLRLTAVILLIMTALLPVTQAQGQSAGPDTLQGKASTLSVSSNPDITAAEIDDLVARIENPESRERLIRHLLALKSATTTLEGSGDATGPRPTHIVGILSERIDRLGKELAAGMALVRDLSRLPDWLDEQTGRPEVRDAFLKSVWQFLLLFLACLLLEIGSRRVLSRSRSQIEDQDTVSRWSRLPLMAARTVLDLLPVIVFATTAYLLLSVIEPVDEARLIALSLVNAIVIARIILSVARMCFAPNAGGLRIPNISDENANYLMLWARRFTNIGCYGFFLSEAALILGLPASGHLVLTRAVGFLLALLVIILILQNRQFLDQRIRGNKATGRPGLAILRRSIGSCWHVLAAIYVAVVYVAWALGLEGLFILRTSALTAAIIAGAWLLMIGSRHLLDRMLGLRPDLLVRFPGLSVRANRYIVILQVVVSTVIWLLAVLSILEIWGINSFAWIGSGLGSRMIGSFLSSAIIVVIAVVFWEVTSSLIERHLSTEDQDERSVGARTRTLLPLAHRALLIVIATVAGFTILSEMGIDIGPLLAGAGVLGLAVGFGSQTLVKDIVTGVFILAEDQFSVGDVITVSGTTGVVEQVTIRTIRIRDLSGNVHIIPYSAVSEVENLTLEFSRYVFDIGVGYSEDVDHVMDVVAELGEEMYADPVWGEHIQSPLEIMGLQEMADSAIVIRARFQTDPGYQWQTGREFNRRIKKKFDELGIEIPFPHRTIYFGEADRDEEGSSQPLTARRDIARPSTSLALDDSGSADP